MQSHGEGGFCSVLDPAPRSGAGGSRGGEGVAFCFRFWGAFLHSPFHSERFECTPIRGGGGFGTRPWWLALLACGGASWTLAYEPSAMTSRHPYFWGGGVGAPVTIHNKWGANGGTMRAVFLRPGQQRENNFRAPLGPKLVVSHLCKLGAGKYEKGGGSGTQNFVDQKWPDNIFQIVNFVLSHDGHFVVWGGGAGGGGVHWGGTPLLLRCRAILILPLVGGWGLARPTDTQRSHRAPPRECAVSLKIGPQIQIRIAGWGVPGGAPAPHVSPVCDIPSGYCSFTGPWTVTRSSLRMLRRVAAFCRPLRPVFLLVSFPHSRSPVVGVLGLCWMWYGVPFARQWRPIIGVLRICWLLPWPFDCDPPPRPAPCASHSLPFAHRALSLWGQGYEARPLMALPQNETDVCRAEGAASSSPAIQRGAVGAPTRQTASSSSSSSLFLCPTAPLPLPLPLPLPAAGPLGLEAFLGGRGGGGG